ncbi:Uncharacterized protein DAT39_016763, partial [Clarias magur]
MNSWSMPPSTSLMNGLQLGVGIDQFKKRSIVNGIDSLFDSKWIVSASKVRLGFLQIVAVHQKTPPGHGNQDQDRLPLFCTKKRPCDVEE